MKLVRRMKKVFAIMGAFVISLPTKVLGKIVGTRPLPTPAPMYGVPDGHPLTYIRIQYIAKFLIIPCILIWGLVVYARKKTDSKLKKFLHLLIILGVIILLAILGLYVYSVILQQQEALY